MPLTLDDLRRFAVARTFPAPTTLRRALDRAGFVQADPIRAPARAQDLTLRHRVAGYRAGDLERRYPELDVEEDYFVTYGFVTRRLQGLMHPRSETGVPADAPLPWPVARRRRAQLLLDFVRERGEVHPREADRRFSHGTVRNYWGGTSNATTHLMDVMHYRGMLRVARRASGIRIYGAHEHGAGSLDPAERRARLDALVDVAVRLYAPLTAASLSSYVRRLRYAVPQWRLELTAALRRARERLLQAKVDGVDWFWPARERAVGRPGSDTVRLLTPFDPLVHDRDRFERLWGWVYRFEAYTPRPKRRMGYYAMPLLWRDRVVGWGNLFVSQGELRSELGYVGPPPKGPAFRRELRSELDRIRAFLGLEP